MSKVSDTMVIPLYGRKLCSELYPELFKDEAAERLVASLDYDFSDIEKKADSAAMRFGALEVACRQTDLGLEVLDYLKAHPKAAVVNLGYDLVTAFETIYFWPGLEKSFSEVCRVLKKGGTFAIHDIMSPARYGDMDAFVAELKAEGYEDVQLIDTTRGKFIGRAESMVMDLAGSKLLVGKKKKTDHSLC